MLQAEDEAEEATVRQQQALRQAEQHLLEEDLKLNRQASSEPKTTEGRDLLNKFSSKFKQGLSEFQGIFGPDDDTKGGRTAAEGGQMSSATRENRQKTLREMVDDEAGTVEEYHFQLPQYSNGDWTLFSPRHGPATTSDPPAGAFNLSVDNDEAIDLERPGASSGAASTGSSSSQGRRNIQVHSAKRLRQNRGFAGDALDGRVAVQDYDDFDSDDEVTRMQRAVGSQVADAQKALSDKMNELKSSFSSERAEAAKQRAKDGSTKAAQKVKESSQVAAQKMKEAGSKMTEKFKSLF